MRSKYGYIEMCLLSYNKELQHRLLHKVCEICLVNYLGKERIEMSSKK